MSWLILTLNPKLRNEQKRKGEEKERQEMKINHVYNSDISLIESTCTLG